jgi:hypothetical protein
VRRSAPMSIIAVMPVPAWAITAATTVRTGAIRIGDIIATGRDEIGSQRGSIHPASEARMAVSEVGSSSYWRPRCFWHRRGGPGKQARSIAGALKEVASLCALPSYGQKDRSAIAVGMIILKALAGLMILVISLS